MKIQPMLKKWLPQVVEIDNRCGYQWKEKDFIQYFLKDDTMGLVLLNEDKVLGFACFVCKNNNMCVTRMAVDEKHRRKKYGSKLYNFLIDNDKFKKYKKIFCVHEKDMETLKFYSAKGLKSQLAKNMFKNNTEDGVVFSADE